MSNEQFELLNNLNSLKKMDMLPKEIPDSILENINPDFELREYQKEAFSRFIFYMEKYNEREKPSQLLFQMATGSGKTLVMAGSILYLYELGYRNFIFFVNSTNIIEKTRTNFLNEESNKYLFNSRIKIGNRFVTVNEVDNFQGVNENEINIHFTTTQGLHHRMNNPKENSITYEDFIDQKIVMLSDEAHHLNAETKALKKKKLNQNEFRELLSWESTVNRIFSSNKENLLLEFTATAELTEEVIANKYKNKLIYDYNLKKFYVHKFSKEVKVLQANLPTIERALQAIVLSQYRYKLFADHNKIIKPVVMFKANYINPPKRLDENTVVSSEFKEEFIKKIDNLNAADLQGIRENSEEDSIIKKAFDYFEQSGTTLENLVMQLKLAFSEDKCISVDSSQENKRNQIIINSLEDNNNQIRAVFAVDSLNEGWDVLNLFDIVRLYDTRDSRNGQVGKTTMAEAQLIGRGARYFPFQLDRSQPLYNRKYDDDLENPLRVCEELYYHSSHNPRYIQELNKALDTIGIKPSNTVQRNLILKEDFKKSDFYKLGVIWVNELKTINNSEIVGLANKIKEKTFKFSLNTGFTSEHSLIKERPEDLDQDYEVVEKTEKILSWFGGSIIRKALQRNPFYNFTNLKTHYSNLKSISEFISSKEYLSNLRVELTGTKKQFTSINPEQKLNIVSHILKDISKDITKDSNKKYGSKTFTAQGIKHVFKDKVLNFNLSDGEDGEKGFPMKDPKVPSNYLDLNAEEWYAFKEDFGTSEEKKLVLFMKSAYEELKKIYSEIYLLRNERHFKLYRYSDGKVVEPDYVLFLAKKGETKQLIYQVFIEPKGGHLLEKDAWKEEFIKEIKNDYEVKTIFQNKDYNLIGLPFYNNEDVNKKEEFKNEFYNLMI
ncbi:type III restriction enzyme [Virgibacillus natechei]|uniref:Type III restriction enzyme n=1 Tax=Virgibacillus natechei TaxID=1216297 RepID=A0ABS4IGD9_9BACI|nr:DEAD/DEAH box helicase family protein [Virgibacillus natechei]MBP1970009.1 type III restriction enzyme [Virgibacillus natechei]UZD13334.1 DEAD/DEAH box helicase family protein [Virgibacillus natechei]